MLEVTIIAKIQTVSIENIFYDGDIVRWRMSMRTKAQELRIDTVSWKSPSSQKFRQFL
jgi:hypothetical protein